MLVVLASPSWPMAAERMEDLLHPEMLISNIEREVIKFGRQLDRVRLETQVQVGSPLLEQWLVKSKSRSSEGSRAIPENIALLLRGFYPDALLDAVKFKVGDPGPFNLSRLSIHYGGAQAVTLIDIVVFKSADDAYKNAGLWAHELHHVQQFAEWGVRDFSERYMRDWYAVEHAAYERQGEYLTWQRARRNEAARLAAQRAAADSRSR